MRAARRGFTRAETSAVEPRYLEVLEAERSRWWSSANFDTWKNLYVSEYARGFTVMDVLWRYLPDFRVRDAAVLDIGCGDAGVMIAFAEMGARAFGIELELRSLYRGRLRAEEHAVAVGLCAGIAEALPFSDAAFELVILDNVLEHVGDQRKTLAEIRRVLRPGGLLYLVTPKPFSLASIASDPHYQLAGLTLLPRPVQVWYFERVRGGGRGTYGVGAIPTRRGVRRLLDAEGFQELTDPRQLWIDYLRVRLAKPHEVHPSKRRLARWLARQEWIFRNPLTRLLLDVGMGANFFIARAPDE